MVKLLDYGPFWIAPNMSVSSHSSHFGGIKENYQKWGFTKNPQLNALMKKVTKYDGKLDVVYAVIDKGFIRGDLTDHDMELRMEGKDYKTMFKVAQDIGKQYPLEGIIIEIWKDLKKIKSIYVSNQEEMSDKAVKMFLRTGKIPDRFTTYD